MRGKYFKKKRKKKKKKKSTTTTNRPPTLFGDKLCQRHRGAASASVSHATSDAAKKNT